MLVDIESIVQELLLTKTRTHPNVTALWLNELFLGTLSLSSSLRESQMQRALKAIQIMNLNELPDLSLGQIALIYSFFSI
jgi:hypothetical protein